MKYPITLHVLTIWLSLLLSPGDVLGDELKCSFDIRGRSYNLCPLFEWHVTNKRPWTISWDEPTPPTRTVHDYTFALWDGGIAKNGTLREEQQCPKGTWICETITNIVPQSPSTPHRITQVIPIAVQGSLDPHAEVRNDTWTKKGETTKDVLRVWLNGGTYADKRQRAMIQFSCDTDKKDSNTRPDFLFKWNGTHYFDWKSYHACPKRVPHHHTSTHLPHQSATPVPGKDKDKEEPAEEPDNLPIEEPEPDGLQLPTSRSPPYFKIASALIVVAGIVFIFNRIAPSTHRQRLLSRFSLMKKRGTRFRPTPEGLVRWASQQPDYEDVDLQSPSSSKPIVYEVDGDLRGEEIPLSPSPGKTTFGHGKGPKSPGMYGSLS